MTPFELMTAISNLRARQWHLDTIGSYAAADSLQPEIDRLTQLLSASEDQLGGLW